MQRYTNFVHDEHGNGLSGASIEVRLAGTVTKATIYSDDGVTTVSNPLTSETDGSFQFYAANGRYDFIITKTGYTFDTDDTAGILLYDPREASVTTAVGNVGSGEDDLISVTLAANSFFATGQAIRITAMGTAAANGNTKQIKLKFGGTTIIDSGAIAINDKDWMIQATIWRTGVDTQEAVAIYFNETPTTVGPVRTALTVDDGAAIIVKCTGEATADNDIVQRGLLVEHLG